MKKLPILITLLVIICVILTTLMVNIYLNAVYDASTPVKNVLESLE